MRNFFSYILFFIKFELELAILKNKTIFFTFVSTFFFHNNINKIKISIQRALILFLF